MGFAAHLQEDRRLAILRLLQEAEGWANESVLEFGLKELGHRRGLTRDTVRDELEWLAERRLVALELVKEVVLVAKLTRRGFNVAEGAETVEGVKKPSFLDAPD